MDNKPLETDPFIEQLRKSLRYEMRGADVVSDITIEHDGHVSKYNVMVSIQHKFSVDRSMIPKGQQRELLGTLALGAAGYYRAYLIKLLLRLNPSWSELNVIGSKAFQTIRKAYGAAGVQYNDTDVRIAQELDKVFDQTVASGLWQDEH